MYNAENVASYVIHKCIAVKQPITNLELQKILFCIQKWYLKNDNIAFIDDFIAEPYGPCILSVYYQYSGYGCMEIDIQETNLVNIDEDDSKIIDSIIKEKLALGTRPFALMKEVCKKSSACKI